MPEHKKIGTLSLNVKKLISLHLLWNTIWKLQWGSLLFITWLILVQIWSESLPKYGSTIIKSLLGTVLATIFCVNTLSKFFLCICQRSHVGNYFYTKYLSIYLFHDRVSQNLNTNWSTGTTVIQLNQFCRFQVWSCWN